MKSLLAVVVVLIGFAAAFTQIAEQCKAQVASTPTRPAGPVEPGAQLFATYCASCHGADARGGERAPDIVRARHLSALSDDDLASLLRRGVPDTGMPAFASLGERSIGDLIAHLRALQNQGTAVIGGDPQAGKALFFGRAGCSGCHMVKGEGGYIASDLTDYATGIPLRTIQLAITEPDTVLAPSSNIVELRLANGQRVTGMARAEDNFHITVQTEDGRWRTFDKSRLISLKYTEHSLHPQDYDRRLSAAQLSDLVSYLISSAASGPQKTVRRGNQ